MKRLERLHRTLNSAQPHAAMMIGCKQSLEIVCTPVRPPVEVLDELDN